MTERPLHLTHLPSDGSRPRERARLRYCQASVDILRGVLAGCLSEVYEERAECSVEIDGDFAVMIARVCFDTDGVVMEVRRERQLPKIFREYSYATRLAAAQEQVNEMMSQVATAVKGCL